MSHQLGWTVISELLKVDDPLERSFYEQQCPREKWSVRELKRQKDTSLFLRLAAGKDKNAILQLASQGQIIDKPSDLLRDPYIFEFLKIPEPPQLTETGLETRVCDHLQPFLLELGKGFTFVGRQYRFTRNNTYYRVDLVFYHRILRCFVLIDFKVDDGSPDSIFRKHGEAARISREIFDAYFEGADTAHGILVSRAWSLREEAELKTLRKRLKGFQPPQSYRYLRGIELTTLSTSSRR